MNVKMKEKGPFERSERVLTLGQVVQITIKLTQN